MRQKGIDRKQSKVRIRQYEQNKANVIIEMDLKEERLELEAIRLDQESTDRKQGKLTRLLQDKEEQSIKREADLDARQKSLETWQEELEGWPRGRGTADGRRGTSKSLILALLLLFLLLVLVIFIKILSF